MTGTIEIPDLPILRPSTVDLAEEIAAAGARFATALAGARAEARAGTLSWTAQQLGAHLATGIDGYTAFLRDEASHLTDLAGREAAGAAAIASESHSSVGDLADRIAAGAASFAAELRGHRSDDMTRFYADRLPVSTIGALLLNELTVHGVDLARIPVPVRAAAIGAPPALALLPMVVKPGRPANATIAFDVRGHGGLVMELRGDAVTLRPPGGRVDVRLSAEPVTFLLACYGRVPQGRAMLARRLAVVGRRPWKLRALQTRFETA